MLVLGVLLQPQLQAALKPPPLAGVEGPHSPTVRPAPGPAFDLHQQQALSWTSAEDVGQVNILKQLVIDRKILIEKNLIALTDSKWQSHSQQRQK